MSMNAQRFARTGHPLLLDPRFAYPDLEGDAELAREKAHYEEVEAVLKLVDEYREEVEQQQRERLLSLRQGKGVAWVAHLKYEVRHAAPVVRIPKRRGVVVQRGHKLCWLQLV